MQTHFTPIDRPEQPHGHRAAPRLRGRTRQRSANESKHRSARHRRLAKEITDQFGWVIPAGVFEIQEGRTAIDPDEGVVETEVGR